MCIPPWATAFYGTIPQQVFASFPITAPDGAVTAADINNLDGDEDRLAKELGKINLLKVGHHGYENSTTSDYIQALSPEFAVVTNRKNGISRTPLKNLNSVKAIVFETGKHNGIVADFTENEIVIYKDIDSGLSVQ